MLELNASDDRGIGAVRNQIQSFASTRTIFRRGFKLIILDEADAMTKDAQNALRRSEYGSLTPKLEYGCYLGASRACCRATCAAPFLGCIGRGPLWLPPMIRRMCCPSRASESPATLRRRAKLPWLRVASAALLHCRPRLSARTCMSCPPPMHFRMSEAF